MSLVAGMGSPTELRERIADYQQECLRQEQEITRLEGRCDDLGDDLAQAKRHIESLRQMLAAAGICNDMLMGRAMKVEVQLAECERERVFQANAHKMAQDALLEQGQQLAIVTKERDELVEAVLAVCCDPEGRVVISGSDGDRAVLQAALAKLGADKTGEQHE